ncbi:MAG: hypothetical protein CL840_12260 [Crocinitomicaceae bacterium]|nr:hypothetical protein [Crocinitomicaceae bacterium]|tara:strand:+ start:626 stop:1942 length:1317 start_codon:yes stop_codon:yes gene_type:complete
MGCGNCSSGACGTSTTPAGCKSNGNCNTGGCGKLDVFDWLSGMELSSVQHPSVAEIRFKNTRKDFYKYDQDMSPVVGDIVVVESSHGYDVGTVSLTGELVSVQMKKKKTSSGNQSLRIKNLANQEDIDRWQKFQEKEENCMIQARKAAKELGLEMKISDVEYQGDGTKATFYYTSEGRVDFRDLIKTLAGKFKIRVEMKQIGTRQEAGRLGGIGSCGRELCCSTWLSDFRTVSTSAARYQQLAINPIKLAGQCGKLKCCLNYELDCYVDALKEFPKGNIKLDTKKGRAFLQKTDIFKKILWFSYIDEPAVFHPLSLDRVNEIVEMNLDKRKPEDLKDFNLEPVTIEKEPDYENVVGQDDLNRFDQAKRKRNKKRRTKNRASNKGDNRGNQNQQDKKQNSPQAKKNNQGANQKKGGTNRNKRRSNNRNQQKQSGGNKKD